MKINITKELLEKYYQGRCSTDEEELVMKWLKAANKAELELIVKERWGQIEGLDNLRQEYNFDAFWKKNKDKIKKIDDEIRIAERRRRIRTKRAAAFILLAIILTLLLAARLWNMTTLAIAHHGETKSIVLPDNSTVILNGGSEIEYAWWWNAKDTREVSLKGEAYFSVTKDQTKPFIVNSNDLMTKVLGTEFNIKAYPEDENVEVTLASGKIQVFLNKKNDAKFPTQNPSVILTPNQQAIYHIAKDYFDKKEVTVENYVAWKKRILVFDKESIREVARAIERFYNVKVILENPQIGDCVMTGKFQNARLSRVLRSIQLAMGIDFEITDRLVVLRGEKCTSELKETPS